MTYVTRQPIKGVYVLGALLFELALTPFYIIKYCIGSCRQHQKWTLRQAILVRVVSSALYHFAAVQVETPLPLTADREKERFVVIKPAKDDAYKGPLRSNKDVVPVEIGATWYPAPLTSGSDTSNVRVILHMHGGAFVVGDGRTFGTGYMANKFLKYTPATHVFSPQYRLSTLPASKTSNAFPAGLQDAVTSYLYLVHDLKIPPKNIVVSGDSAGGNLATVLVRYLSEYGPELDLPTPLAALLWSPWIDPSNTSCSYVHDNPNYKTDMLSPPLTQWGSAAYAGLPGLQTLSQPYISQKDKTFKCEVPMWVNVGGAEVLYYDVVEWAQKMKEAGNDVQLDIDEYAPHDILAQGNILGFNKEAVGMAKRAGVWLKEHGI
ncbi:alpha beta hydrolase fold-3 domain containing protein [Pyrenophora tritici-repentis]|uniref:Alpha-beta hydrolase fold-3 domain containing protein n=2 Tax=Pyrenophora tritici-repentis TaxID=45151 RepID=A0A2W1CZS7_9PLEO|nr:alpha/beta hydrolase fold-3 domain containing protein [Pyrenophora tritici-repentis Pt-1C-BFP]KAA8613800.1 alpha/beta hydrolase fold-3 domain-containing protein [Pyrenophora tritici-repentis]EDU49615.1 alpha/beta hydrolase fold-3 domain containing protein [Pyrenophora tritici-repentis Pt-1C-BFP]KAF7565803.1 alpha-beta hydrolase fold-3 domain containing protein [Pyrenophora tritici-repentis]KAG9380101.1 alpha/beta hydrolase fold-3 domain containing protein [Pyrenophora tritici-repentis]KAI05